MNLEHKTVTPALFPLLSIAFVFVLTVPAFSQTKASNPPVQPAPTRKLEKEFFANVLRDQKGIWTAPFHLQQSDAKWVAPFGLSMAALIASDRHTSGELFEHGERRDRVRISKDISYAGSLYTAGGISGIFYLAGRWRHDDRAKETGLLAAEALIDSTIVSEALKGVSQRQRPEVDHSSGEFFEGGSSFPSGHAINAWTLATIISHEYGPRHAAARYAAYGLAAAVSVSRYTAGKHFISDVLAGSLIGYGIGRYVYHEHHDTSLDSDSEQQSQHDMKTRLFPDIAPAFNRQAHLYGVSVSWKF